MRIFWFIAMALGLIMIPMPWVLLAVGVYGLRYEAWELVVLAICIDGYFGTGVWPQYTLLVGGVIITIEIIRPHLFYTKNI